MTGDAPSIAHSAPQCGAAGVAPDPSGRVVIEGIRPKIDDGRTPAKRILGDRFEVSAAIFTDGHHLMGADVLYKPRRDEEWLRATMQPLENDLWRGSFLLERQERYDYTIEAWRDPFASWRADTMKKIAAGADVAPEAADGLALVRRAERDTGIDDLLGRLEATGADARLAMLLSDEAVRLMARCGPRDDRARSAPTLTVIVEGRRARFSSWYELFPRSTSPLEGRHGRFADVVALLPYVRDMGFDILYFPPIHPIGATNRKGRNNALVASAGDPGSVYAIGSKAGGHDAIHPELGSLDDFRRLVAAANAQGLAIALDFAVQCSPDHPWIKERPDWFERRSDGSLRYAENPPKTYEDIVNFRFDGPAFPALWLALRDVVLFWINEGVRIFRVDNPHTKPVPFWRWLIREVNALHPDVLFLAEAFTRPRMMKKLAKIGFQQSYTYFTWRNAKAELIDYATELAGDAGEYLRPNFFVNTPDINPTFLQNRGPPAFMIRATLAATLASNWDFYSGFEFCELTPLPEREEYLNSEKYELKHRDYSAPGPLAPYIRRLNEIRMDNPALHDFRNIKFLNAWNDQVIAYVKMTPNRDNCLFIMVTLDPDRVQETTYELPLWEFGLPDHAALEVDDLLLGIRFTMHGKTHVFRFDPRERVAVVWRLTAPVSTGPPS